MNLNVLINCLYDFEKSIQITRMTSSFAVSYIKGKCFCLKENQKKIRCGWSMNDYDQSQLACKVLELLNCCSSCGKHLILLFESSSSCCCSFSSNFFNLSTSYSTKSSKSDGLKMKFRHFRHFLGFQIFQLTKLRLNHTMRYRMTRKSY